MFLRMGEDLERGGGAGRPLEIRISKFLAQNLARIRLSIPNTPCTTVQAQRAAYLIALRAFYHRAWDLGGNNSNYCLLYTSPSPRD